MTTRQTFQRGGADFLSRKRCAVPTPRHVGSLSMKLEPSGIENDCVPTKDSKPWCAQMVKLRAEPDGAQADEHFQAEDRKDKHVCFSTDGIVVVDGWMQTFEAMAANPSSGLIQGPVPAKGE